MGSDPPHRPFSPPPPSTHDEQPLAEEDVIKMRARIADMGFSSDAMVQDLTSKEKELGGMVVRLLDSFIDPAQLLRQAEFITWLGTQRDLLVRSFEEERQRWEAEREGWNRMAEALLAQQAKAGNSASRTDEEVEHQQNVYESENKALREKLQDYQLRFSALESELCKLKPLLLMQPPISNSAADNLSDSKSLKSRRKTADSPSVGEPTTSKDTNQPDDSTHNTPRSEYYRRHAPGRSSFLTPSQSRILAQQTPMRSVFSVSQTPSTHPGSPKKPKYRTKKSHHNNLLPLSADARTEHLLLAARRIGRERANTISGLMRRIEKERENLMQERDADRLDREKAATGAGHPYYRKDVIDFGTGSSSVASSITPSMPKTPKRGNAEGQSTTHFLTPTTLMTPRSDLYSPLNNPPSSFVFFGSTPASSYHNSVFTPRPAGHAQVNTPAAKPARRTSATPATTHPTPLASLLSAAKSMMDDESNEPSPNSNSRRRTGTVEPPDSPVPKRRRVGKEGNTSGGNRGKVDMLAAASTLGTDRVRSALDVLADQAAAAFDEDWPSPSKSPDKMTKRSRGKDKGYDDACPPVVSNQDMFDDSTPKGRVRSVERSPGLGRTGSPVSTRSRSRALLTDRLSKGTARSQPKNKDKPSGTLPSSAHSAPRMIFSPLLRSPTLPLSPSPAAATPASIPAEDGNDHDRVVVDKESRSQEKRFLDDDNPTSSFTDASDSPALSSMGDDRARVPSDPALIGSENGDIMAVDDEPNNEGETSESGSRLVGSVAENHEDTVDSAAVGSQGGEETKGVERLLVEEGAEVAVTKGGETQGHSVHGGSPDDAYDTDADAEGEMDVEAEETVFMGSSSIMHVPAVSTYSLGASDVIDQPAEAQHSRGARLTES